MVGNVPANIKPIADAVVEAFNHETGEKKSYKAPSIVPTYVDDGKVYASSVLLNSSGNVAGTVSIDGIPIEEWPKEHRQTGRPRNDEKRVAVFLAWCLELNRNGERRSAADETVAKLFSYASARGKGGVSDIRTTIVTTTGIDLASDILHIKDGSQNDPLECAVYLKKTTVYTSPGVITVLGIGFSWLQAFAGDSDRRCRVMSGAHKIELLTAGMSESDLNETKKTLSGGGAKVITRIFPRG